MKTNLTCYLQKAKKHWDKELIQTEIIIAYIFSILLFSFIQPESVNAGSKLLENVKRNKSEAISLCNQFKELNAKGILATSSQAIRKVAKQKNLTYKDAEILSFYVIGLNCPDVR